MVSGFPGFLVSTDDFYVTSQKLVIVETSNDIYNNSLYDLLTPYTVPYWIRNVVANQLATSGRSWHEWFYRYNSGTYNNQWMVLDYKLFTPGQPLPPWTFSVSEQLPEPHNHPAEDLTLALQRGHWPSYNVAYFDDVYKVSGYPDMVQKHGVQESYQLAPRAPIFRREAEKVNSMDELHRFMRLNGYGSGDPLAFSPSAAIASRGDLNPKNPKASGAIDAKAVNAALVDALAMTAIAGPTSQGQPPFAFKGQWTDVPHFGAPESYVFDWLTISVNGMRPTRQHSTMLFA